MSSSWSAYLDELEAALRDLHAGSSQVDFPSLDDRGPLPEELRGRAEGLLRATVAAAGPISAMRAEAKSRLSLLASRSRGSRALRA